jgi:hypothetical protein
MNKGHGRRKLFTWTVEKKTQRQEGLRPKIYSSSKTCPL